MIKTFLAAIGILTIMAGCGVYSFKGQGIAGIKSIAVQPFDNKSTEFGIRETITDAVITRLLADRTLKLAPLGTADAILSGTVISVEDRPLTYTASETVSEYVAVIAVDVAVIKRGVADPVWQGRLVGEGNYPFNGAADERKQGIDKAIDKIVQDLMNRMTSDW